MGQELWGSGPDTGTGQGGQTWALTAALPGAHSRGQGDTVWPSFVCGYSSTRHWAYWKSLRPELRQRGKAAWSLCPCFFMWGMVIILALPSSQGCCEEPTAQGGGCLWPPQGTGNQSPSLLL